MLSNFRIVLNEMLPKDVRYAFRTMVRSLGFTSIAVFSLALGIGANAAIFSLADALLLRPLPVPDPNGVYTVTTDMIGDEFPEGVSYPNYRDMRDHLRSFQGVVAFRSTVFSFAQSVSEIPQRRAGMIVSDNFFPVMDVQPFLGRGFLPQEAGVSSGSAVVVLGYDLWNEHFNHDLSVVGRSVRINGLDFNVVGVAPKGFVGLDYLRTDLFVPAVMAQRLTGDRENAIEARGDFSWEIKGRLKPGVSQQAAQAEIGTLWKDLQQQFPEKNLNRTMAVHTELQARVRQKLYVAVLAMLMVLVVLVLVIACANVANLLLGRSRSRSREIAVRIALGVTRMRLLRQLLTESLILSLIGAIVGLVFAYLGIRFLQTIPLDSDLPAAAPQLDYRVLVFSVLAALVSTLLFGLAPAWHSSKTELISTLKNTGPSVASRHRGIGHSMLVIGQVALSMVLLVAAGMLLDGFRTCLLLDPGFRTDHRLIMQLDTSLVRYNPAQTRSFYHNLSDRVRALPGVRSATLTHAIPLSDQDVSKVIPEGYAFPKGQDTVSLLADVVDEHYFDTMKVDILSGRAFTADDKDGSRPVAIINDEFAKRYWPGQSAVGKRLRLDDAKGPWLDIVGVTKTGKYLSIAEPATPYIYLPFAQRESTSMSLIAETYGDPAAAAASVVDIVHALDVNLPVYNVRSFSNFYQRYVIAVPLMIMQLVFGMGLLGLALALVGVYGLVAYSVARRTKEIGIRMAIGADRSNVMRMVLRDGLMLAGAGLVVGGLMSIAMVRLLAAGLSGLALATPNPVTFVGVPLAVFAVTIAACYIPARRASLTDPTRALTCE